MGSIPFLWWCTLQASMPFASKFCHFIMVSQIPWNKALNNIYCIISKGKVQSLLFNIMAYLKLWGWDSCSQFNKILLMYKYMGVKELCLLLDSNAQLLFCVMDFVLYNILQNTTKLIFINWYLVLGRRWILSCNSGLFLLSIWTITVSFQQVLTYSTHSMPSWHQYFSK